MITHRICALAAGALLVAACGSSDDSTEPIESAVTVEAADPTDPASDFTEVVNDATDEAGESADEAADEAIESAEEFADDIADDLEAVQASEGGGGATLVANGQTWQFDSVLCAFGEDQIGVAGSVFNLSAIADGLQLYASIDDSGASHSLSINDIENFEDPSVSLSISPFVAAAAGTEPEFLTLDDKTLSAEVVMIDDTTGAPTAEPAVLTATCP